MYTPVGHFILGAQFHLEYTISGSHTSDIMLSFIWKERFTDRFLLTASCCQTVWLKPKVTTKDTTTNMLCASHSHMKDKRFLFLLATNAAAKFKDIYEYAYRLSYGGKALWRHMKSLIETKQSITIRC